MRDRRESMLGPFSYPATKVEAVVKGRIEELKGKYGVHVGQELTSVECKLISVFQEGVPGGLWAVQPVQPIHRVSFYSLITSEVVSTGYDGRGFARVITNFNGSPLRQLPYSVIRRLRLDDRIPWFGVSRELLVVEAFPYSDEVKLRHCLVKMQDGRAYLHEYYLPVVNGSEALKVGYHTFNGDLSQCVAEMLGSRAGLADAVLSALEFAHCPNCLSGTCDEHSFQKGEER